MALPSASRMDLADIVKAQRYVVLFYLVGCLVWFVLPKDLKYKVAIQQGRDIGLARWVPEKSKASQSRAFQVRKVSMQR